MGEPRRLTADVQQRISQHVEAGNYGEVAAQLAGVPRRTFQRWMHDGRQDLDNGLEHTSVARLALAVEKARASVIAAKVKRVQEAGASYWQADAWWLERNFPDLYGRRLEATIEERSVRTVTFQVEAQYPRDVLAFLAQQLLEQADGRGSPRLALPEAPTPTSDP